VAELSRRQLLSATAAALGAVAFTGCAPPAQKLQAQSRLHLAEDTLTAFENFYATTCRQCPGGCGMLVRVIEGRAKKAEGNPDHPVNRGKLCARGQAVVQEQYHPDRLTGPMQAKGGRGTGSLAPLAWSDALDLLSTRLRDLQQSGRANQAVLLTGPLRGMRASLVGNFARAYGAEWQQLDLLGEAPLREAVKRVFGQDTLPDFDVEHAQYIVSFGADFLSTWLSPVHYGVAYGAFRQGSYRANQFQPRQDRPRGRFVQVEPRFSMTAANADEWLPIRSGQEGRLALSLAQVIVSEGLADASAAAIYGDASALDAYRPEAVAQVTGVAAERIRQLARDLAHSRPALVLGGGAAGATTNGADSLTAVLELNVLLGNVGQPGGVRFNPPVFQDAAAPPPPGSFTAWQQLVQRLRAGEFQVVLVHGTNLAFELASLGFTDALAQVPFVASFSSFLDETTARSDLVLATSLPLEDWGDDVPDPGPGVPVVTFQQPVVQPYFDTRGFGDVLLQLAARLGGGVQQALPWATYKDALRETARRLQQLNRGSVQEADFERFWVTLLQHGGWWDSIQPSATAASSVQAGAALQRVVTNFAEPVVAGDAGEYPFQLVVFPHNTLGAGETAHLPWLQAAPDPITSVVWQTWVEVNPDVAGQLALREGDIVGLESPQGRIEVPVYISPAAPPDVLAVPLGQGHANYGRWAERRGTNPLSLLVPLTEASTGALAYAATRVRLTRTERKITLPKFEGNVPAFQVPDDEVLQVVKA
jgi:menaquinone reductase, molybdopterin-binding-like subunit